MSLCLQVQSPCLDSGDEASLKIDRSTYQHMFQDIVSLKTMLLKLKRVLQEVRRCSQRSSSVCRFSLRGISARRFYVSYKCASRAVPRLFFFSFTPESERDSRCASVVRP